MLCQQLSLQQIILCFTMLHIVCVTLSVSWLSILRVLRDLQIPKPGGIRKGWMRQFVVVCDFKLFLYDYLTDRPSHSPVSNIVSQVIDMRWVYGFCLLSYFIPCQHCTAVQTMIVITQFSLSVFLSVCLSVTCCYHVKTTELIFLQSVLHSVIQTFSWCEALYEIPTRSPQMEWQAWMK